MASVTVGFEVAAKEGSAEIVRTLSVGDSSVELTKETLDKLTAAIGQDQGFYQAIEVAEVKKGGAR